MMTMIAAVDVHSEPASSCVGLSEPACGVFPVFRGFLSSEDLVAGAVQSGHASQSHHRTKVFGARQQALRRAWRARLRRCTSRRRTAILSKNTRTVVRNQTQRAPLQRTMLLTHAGPTYKNSNSCLRRYPMAQRCCSAFYVVALSLESVLKLQLAALSIMGALASFTCRRSKLSPWPRSAAISGACDNALTGSDGPLRELPGRGP